MINRIIRLALQARIPVLLMIAGVTVYGAWLYFETPRDAFPDISPVMVPVFAEAPGMAPEEVERHISIPVENTLSGLPDVTLVKSTSSFGMAVIYVYFADHVDMYFARQLVAERLAAATASLPAAVGFIALFGIAMQDGVVMVTDFRDLRAGECPCASGAERQRHSVPFGHADHADHADRAAAAAAVERDRR